MVNKIIHEKFVNKLQKIQPNIKIIGNYKSNNSPILFLYKKYFYKMRPYNLLQGTNPNARSLIYKKRFVYDEISKCNKNINYIKSANSVNDIIAVDNDGFEYKNSYLNFLKEFNIRSCTDKTSLIKFKFKKVHGDKYNYSKVKYVNTKNKVKIICENHGIFYQGINEHLKGSGCIKCSLEKRSIETRSNINEFIKKAKYIHNNKYDYSKSEYKGSLNKIIIICPIHGEFEQLPSNHLQGNGCLECRYSKSNTKEFIKKSKKIHGNKYDYSKVKYYNNHTKVKIICLYHGEFEQSPNQHLRNRSCPICANENRGWTYKKWSESGNKSRKFDSFKVYIIQCWDENEEFYKIGKTFYKISNRFNGKNSMPYNYEIITSIDGDARYISELEHNLHNLHRNKYQPKISFSGDTECFSSININLINDVIKNMNHNNIQFTLNL